jgi:hypothetical protein
MTHITHRLEVHCPYVFALRYFDQYFLHLGWSERSPSVELPLRVPLAGLGLKDLAVEKTVLATFEHSPEHRGLENKINVRWRPEDDAPYPTFDGTLSLAAATPKASVLTLDGEYEPPLGTAGKVFDAAIGHRIAEATAHELLKEIGDRIELSYLQDEPHHAR